MKNGLIVEKAVFLFLLFLSGWIVYSTLTKSHFISSDNALLIILSSLWIVLEYKTVKKLVKRFYLTSKKTFHFTGKRKLHKI